MDGTSLTPIEQRTVIFYDDEITAVVVEENGRQVVYVPVRPICDFLGVDWSAQHQRINRDPILSRHFVVVTTTKSGRGNPHVSALPLDYLNGWLFGINANRVNEGVRDKLLRYQEECYRVLADAFLSRSPETDVTPIKPTPVRQSMSYPQNYPAQKKKATGLCTYRLCQLLRLDSNQQPCG